MDSTTFDTKLPTSSRPVSPELVIVKLDNESDDDVHDFPPPSAAPNRPRVALRRKKHLSIYRASAPVTSPVAEVKLEIPCVQRPQSMLSPSALVRDDLAAVHAKTKPLHARTHSQPNVRLGHPSRPYYSAIRPNMSRPNSPLGDVSTNSTHSPPTSLAIRPYSPPSSFAYSPNSFEDGDDYDYDSPTAASPVVSLRPSSSRFSFRLGFGAFSTPPSALNTGSSVSGEMEMRMALAALARESRQDGDRFRFHEAAKPPGSVMRKLGQGLKDLVRRKHADT